MEIGGIILKEAKEFYVVCAFKETVVFPDEAFMAMVVSFLPQTNTFIVIHGEIGLTFKELSAITELPIIGKRDEEFMTINKVVEEQPEAFQLLYFQLVDF